MASAQQKDSQQKDSKETRLLLWVWFATQGGQVVTEAQAIRKLKRKTEAAAAYREVLKALRQEGAIALEKTHCTLTAAGEARLAQRLLEPGFELSGAIAGTWVVNALLAWMRRSPAQSAPATAPAKTTGTVPGGNGQAGVLTTYEAFQAAALETYRSLNQDYNLDDLVPIYRIRRTLGDRLSRAEFDEWLLKMQSQDLVQLIGGEMPELTPDKAEDSIQTRMGAIRYYVKSLPG